MSERLPYEEQLPQQLRDFPLPDENAAWEDMKRRLEEDDDDRVIFWWRKGCAGWGLLLLVLLTIGWWVLREKGGKEKKSSIVNITPSGRDSIGDTTDDRTGYKQQYKTDSGYTQQPDTIFHQAIDSTDEQAFLESDKHSSKNIPRAEVPSSSLKKKRKQERITKTGTTAIDTNILQPGQKTPGQTTRPPEQLITQPRDSDSAVTQRATAFITGDSSIRSPEDSLANKINKADTTANTKKKTDSLQKKEIFFSAGLALNQQIPVAGQKTVPYSAQGREFSLADYIPSVYFRLNKKDRWFIQGEFRYGAPQYTKPLIYSEQTDTISPSLQVTTTKQLQKTYYHQLPFSFNYFVLPEWSLGAGLVWNKFSKSIYEETIFNSNPSSPLDTAYSKETLTSKQPGELSKTYFQALLETQYQWRRFSLGARYTFGLQPYIKFTLPGQAEQKERNQSLQVFLRYELFRTPRPK